MLWFTLLNFVNIGLAVHHKYSWPFLLNTHTHTQTNKQTNKHNNNNNKMHTKTQSVSCFALHFWHVDCWCAHFLFVFLRFFSSSFFDKFFLQVHFSYYPQKDMIWGLGAMRTGGKYKAVKIFLSPVSSSCALKITILSTKDCDLCLCSIISEQLSAHRKLAA